MQRHTTTIGMAVCIWNELIERLPPKAAIVPFVRARAENCLTNGMMLAASLMDTRLPPLQGMSVQLATQFMASVSSELGEQFMHYISRTGMWTNSALLMKNNIDMDTLWMVAQLSSYPSELCIWGRRFAVCQATTADLERCFSHSHLSHIGIVACENGWL